MGDFRCPICRRYSDRFETENDLDQHIISVHPKSKEAVALLRATVRKGYGQQ